MELQENIRRVEEKIAKAAASCGRDPKEITLVAATKTQDGDTIRRAIASGIGVCGENRVQEFLQHQKNQVYDGARVDFIGHLQSNKVKQIVGQVELIHSVGSRTSLEAIGKEAKKQGLSQKILLEVNISKETSKSGFFVEELDEIFQIALDVPEISLKGLMAIPPKMEDITTQRKIFESLYQLYIDFSAKISDNREKLECLSMGMSDDYELAIAEGSTMVRVGTALFGPRTV